MTLFPASRDVITDRGDAGRRLDLVLRRHLADIAAATRTQIQVWIENGQVRMDGQPVRRAATRAHSGAHVSILLPERAARIGVTAEDLALDVLYEDDHLLAVSNAVGGLDRTGRVALARPRMDCRPAAIAGRPARQTHVRPRRRREDGSGAHFDPTRQGITSQHTGIPRRRLRTCQGSRRRGFPARERSASTAEGCGVACARSGELHTIRTPGPRGRAARRHVVAPLSAADRPQASDPCPSRRERVAARRRSGLR